MLEAHGFALRPKTILVGLFENDFAEIADFDAWQRSGLDWFEFHSGTWCGPPVRVTAFGRLIDGTFPGYQGLARVIRARVRGERMSISGPTDAQVSRVAEELQKIVDLASTNSAAVCLVLIPSKPTAQGDVTAEANAFDDLLDRLGKPTAGTIDLRPVFQAHPDPLSLYYQQDGHWNPDGVALAFQEIHKRLSAPPMTDES